MKITITILFIIMISPKISGQEKRSYDYYKDTTKYEIGAKLQIGSDLMNSRFCQIRKGESVFRYGPSEISEYGFKDGRTYVSKEISILNSVQKVFLERLVKGKLTLYYYRGKGLKTYYLEKDSTLFIEIPKKDNKDKSIGFNEKLSDNTSDCHNVSDAAKLVQYNKKSLSKLITRYNNCELKPFPHFRYGLIFGYEFAKLIPNTEYENQSISYFDFKYDGGFLTGLFIDYPVSATDFSLHTELNFSRHGFSYNKLIENKDIDFVSNISSLKLPFLIRYEYPLNNFRPFINLGLIGSYYIRKENILYETTITENLIEINDTEELLLIDDIQIGYCIGAGIECNINFKNSIFFEFRYNNQYHLINYWSMKIPEFKFVTGINF